MGLALEALIPNPPKGLWLCLGIQFTLVAQSIIGPEPKQNLSGWIVSSRIFRGELVGLFGCGFPVLPRVSNRLPSQFQAVTPNMKRSSTILEDELLMEELGEFECRNFLPKVE